MSDYYTAKYLNNPIYDVDICGRPQEGSVFGGKTQRQRDWERTKSAQRRCNAERASREQRLSLLAVPNKKANTVVLQFTGPALHKFHFKIPFVRGGIISECISELVGGIDRQIDRQIDTR